MGAPFVRRGERCGDYLTALKKLWPGQVAEHDSEVLSWLCFKSYPLPLQRPHPPLSIGGDTGAALARVAAHGDGWFAPPAIADLEGLARRLRWGRGVVRPLPMRTEPMPLRPADCRRIAGTVLALCIRILRGGGPPEEPGKPPPL